LLNFIIFGGGLGASIATVRMMAEKYFLVIQNGPRQGTEIPIHKWMNATGGGRMVTIGMIGDCEIQMNWEKSNKVAKEHAQLYIEQSRKLPVIKPLTTGVFFNNRVELPPSQERTLTNGDLFMIGDTVFLYIEKD
ncbi:MAG: FHA domain-containing protein, partial [Muribaculaceae bacterium]|nr:FHA domain-containing protein [Muribaculaceae bacterium]